ncbi:DUF1501 domain-containing protein [Fuerstiella marisgermanici]|uniref:DUF1501 domain-containing protein n=1 Tax=Fuerstiella marisgermanici TaxID=1891926 RepID=A0A1P8WMC7_9PLAN|nr:DUF1501 domain-containing protein [Fuerstiella marisgermanici]APZ95197.1 hypothetical protein Fuma_04852 [Fuerstiella marisgermanici]
MSHSSRRQFLTTSAAATSVLTFGRRAPAFLQQAAADSQSDGRILVVVEMAGGNDGLNTVVPYTDDEYRKARPELAIGKSDVLKINDNLGLHPVMTGFADLLEAGHLSIIQGVGYDNPNRSHFESMDIWHTCQRKDENRIDGWLGRYLQEAGQATSSDPAGLHLGEDKQPFALMSRDARVPSIRSLDQFRLNGNETAAFRKAVRELADARRDGGNDLLSFVQSSTSSAITASERIEVAGMNYKPSGEYPSTALANKLQTVAKLINSGLTTPVYYVRIDGFDTHAQQDGAHQSLLRQVSDGVSTFLKDMMAHGHGDRILCLCFSEFGRRVAENASKGTDHGTAGPVFLTGTHVKAGLIGQHPSLRDLQDGDLKHHTDFRQVYATVLERWLKCDSKAILRGKFNPLNALPPT